MNALVKHPAASEAGLSPTFLPETVKECRGVLAHHARSFSAAAVFLPSEMRDRAAVAYAFCRLVDDAVDEATSQLEATRELNRIERMLDGEQEPNAVVSAYREMCLQLGVGLQPARDLIAGARSDLSRVRLAGDAELLEYCYRVAGTVGLMMCGILGVKEQEARAPAIHLGIAMQLTNICRDVLEDAVRDRVYLPAARLERVGVSQADLVQVGTAIAPSEAPDAVRHGVAQVVGELLTLADEYYASAVTGFEYIPTRPRLAISIAKSLYREIGMELRRRGTDPLRGRTRVGGFRKVILVMRKVITWTFDMEEKSKPTALLAYGSKVQ